MKKLLLIAVSFLLFAPALVNAQGPCTDSIVVTATPPPMPGGFYPPGAVVNVCISVYNYAQSGVDWIAGVVPTFGPGWDISTLTPVSISPSCDGIGVWGFYPSCTGTASGLTFGPGFYYDTPAGSVSGTLDGIPGNNFGDNCANFTWTFCFTIQVFPNALNGTDLTINAYAYSDYTCGSWGTDACSDPPATLVAEVMNCSLIVPTVTITNSTCANTNDGSITVIPQGVAPYTYNWSTGATTSTISNLPPGIYTVTVTDSTTCSKEVTIPVGGPPPLNLNPTVVNNGCVPGGGSVTLAPSGGNGAPYTYLWNDGSTSSSITNLAGGTYIVTVTDSLNCVQTDTFNINTVIPISLTTSSTSASCGVSNGSATVNVSGGTPQFTYSWSPAGGTGPVAANLPAGTYTVTVTDSAGCTASAQVIVQAFGQFTLSTQFVPLTCDPLGTTSATVNVSGGTAPYTYQWTPSGGNQATATGLTSGTYVVYVTDSANCVDSATVVIPSIIPVTLSSNTTPVMCGYPSSGSVTVVAAGGTAPYTYLWSDGSTTSMVNNLPGGTYTVTVTDAEGCSATTTMTVSVIPDVFVSAGTDQTVCSGQQATLTGSGSGGTPPFSYNWDNGSTNATITVSPAVTTSYIVTVTDANNCTATDTVTVIVENYPVVAVTPDTDICFGSGITLQASGGASYSWTPSNGLSDPGISNPVASPVATTTYTVTVSNGLCSSTGSVTITVEPEVVASFSPDTTGGEAPLTVSFNNASSGAVSYNWNFGDGGSSTDPTPSHTYTQQGNYTVVMIAISTLGCTDTASYSFIVVDELASLTVPNVFTPNGDGLNDTFEFIEKGISSISVVIFNRWGKEVYSWSKVNGSWDGKSEDGEELPDGVYLYVIKARGIDDKSYDFQGAVHLIRNKK